MSLVVELSCQIWNYSSIKNLQFFLFDNTFYEIYADHPLINSKYIVSS